ncbi:MAG TPA: hypothetical protein VK150_04850 [Geothrix sp.]|nr:hypothetical protein [Geothrix sp.]
MVDLVIEHVGSELTRAKAISALNRAQNYYLARTRIGLMRIKPDPFLVTTAGTFDYAASTALFSSAGGVLGATQWDIRDLGLIYALDGLEGQFAYGGHDHVSQYPLEVDIPEGTPGLVKAPADWIPSRESLSEDCLITFWEDNDPGTTTIEWRAQAYRWPTQFTSESVAFEMPEAYQDTLLLWKTLESLGVKQYGAASQNIRSLLQEEEPAFFTFAGRAGGRVQAPRTPPRW